MDEEYLRWIFDETEPEGATTMKDYVNEHFRANTEDTVRKSIALKGNRFLSVQASQYHHCGPRETNYCRYYSVEVMAFTGGKTRKSCIPGWERWENGNVYSYIPVDVVNAYIEKIGLRDEPCEE